MKVTKVKVGVVGLGLVCDSYIKAYVSHHDAEVVAVCDLDEARAKAVAEGYGVPKCYTSYDEMLKDSDINTVDITTPTLLHAPMSLAAAKAGKNILCEKPFCLTLEEGLAVCREAEKHGVILMVGESYIFMTSIKRHENLSMPAKLASPNRSVNGLVHGLNALVLWKLDVKLPISTVAGAWIRRKREVPGSRGCSTIVCTFSLQPNI